MADIKQLIKELHKPVKPVKQFRKVRTNGLDDVWGIDLMFMPSPEENDGYKYVLIAVDIFSRYAWLQPLKSKDGTATWKAMTEIFKEAGTKPRKLWADSGGEFYNAVWKLGLKREGVKLYSTFSDWGVANIESLIKTLKTWLMPKYEERGSLRWVELLPDTLEYYNTKHIHKALNMTPYDARDKRKEAGLMERLYGREEEFVEVKPKFKVGDWVRVASSRQAFFKGYEARWSYNAYLIRRVSLGNPVMYYLKESDGTEVEGGFYENELQRTEVPMTVLVQEIKERRNGKVLVSYRGLPKKYDEWIKAKDVRDLRGG